MLGGRVAVLGRRKGSRDAVCRPGESRIVRRKSWLQPESGKDREQGDREVRL